MAVFLLVFGVAGCSSDDASGSRGSSGSAPPTADVTSSSVAREPVTTTIVSAAGTTRVLEPPVTFAGDPDASGVVAGLGDRLLGTEPEKACVAERLAADPALLARVKAGVAPGSEDFEQLQELSASCVLVVRMAPVFVEQVAQSHPGLSEATKTCLGEAVGGLSDEQVSQLTAAGVDPQGSLAPKGAAVLQGLLDGCGVAS